MNAYELAEQVEMWGEDLLALNMKGGIPVVQGAKMLRQQADRIAELEKLTREPTKVFAVPDLMAKAGFFKRKPLSDEEILNLYKETGANNGGIREFVRAIEERHGIK